MRNDDTGAFQLLLVIVVIPYLIYKIYQALCSDDNKQPNVSLCQINESDKVNGGFY